VKLCLSCFTQLSIQLSSSPSHIRVIIHRVPRPLKWHRHRDRYCSGAAIAAVTMMAHQVLWIGYIVTTIAVGNLLNGHQEPYRSERNTLVTKSKSLASNAVHNVAKNPKAMSIQFSGNF